MLHQETFRPVVALRMSLLERFNIWLREDSPWWLCSFGVHSILVCSLAFVGTKVGEQLRGEPEQVIRVWESEPLLPPLLLISPDDRAWADEPVPPLENIQSSELPTTIEPAPFPASDFGGKDFAGQKAFDNVGPNAQPGLFPGNLPTAKVLDPLSKLTPHDSLHASTSPDADNPWIQRTSRGNALPAGSTRAGDQAVSAALKWLVRHQQSDGRWSLTNFGSCCRDASCTSPGKVESDVAGTALAILPLLAAGYTHLTPSGVRTSGNQRGNSAANYRRSVNNGLYWLLRNQKPDGDLRAGSTMYAHGLATIVLCEAYGMTNDPTVGQAAQRAIEFIQAAQNRKTGGWRYQPGTLNPGDTSVVGWQVMALKSGQMARLRVDPAALDRAGMFLRSVSTGGGCFSYTPGVNPNAAMTAVGLLCSQYLGAQRTDSLMVEGTSFLMKSQPGQGPRDVYYLYYATQVMHNQPGPDWDIWNRNMRRLLIDAQCRGSNCAAGSWNPETPEADQWGVQGGRLMMTSLAALSLEVYYRHIPLYQLDGSGLP